ncbi:nuclear factor NF-kappa-B p100 subunit isoform X3 [Anguilla anguilla]|uniref:nuclear factor NF-kappa-B p100 subunit isoform X3 n=1 Tax=Anguilla anguilla TaxID=7936 RepID=UPI0015AB8278|nr:nuclear factor NF-kappa-B p100 subunit isoform X3 [Anguilla anguilla]
MSGTLRMDDTHYNMNMIENELMMDLTYQFMAPPGVKSEPYVHVPEIANGPYVQIIEEPKQRGFRFRYECEGPSHGGLPGASSEKNKKTYPTVKVSNYLGRARVEVQLVTHTDPPRVHAHSLVGKQCNENGTCSVEVGPNDLTAQFNNLGILHVTKRGVAKVLAKRLKEEKRKLRDPNYHFTEEQAILSEAKELGKVMDLNVVRLRFTAYLQDGDGGFTRALKPAISNPIFDSKSPNASNLKISRMDKTCGTVMGGDEIFLLCDKVQKDDIDIRFYEEEEGGWEAYGDFSPTDVHKQYAIVFKTPQYHSTGIDRPVTVFLQLKRRKGGDCSEPKQFTYVPHVQDKEEVQRKRQKPLPHSYDHWRGPLGGAGGPGRGQGGFGGAGGGGGGGGLPYGQSTDGGNFHRGFTGFGGGGAQMSSSAQSQQPASRGPLQQQLLQLASSLQSRATHVAQQTAGALLDYCSTGDVRILLAVQRHLCAVQDENGDTPLHVAIIHQQPAVVQQLVCANITLPQQHILNTQNHLSQTPLHLAVITRQHKVADFLLRAGADPALLDRDGRSAVHLAATLGDEGMLRVLLFHLGERHAHLLNTPDYSGLFPLHLAVRKGGERSLRVLVEGGANVNAAELKSGSTALHLAVRENLFKMACLLITELTADVNACTFGGNTPLHLAACQGSPKLCSMLIAAGARKHLENDEPLFFSSSSSSDEEEEEEEEEEERVGDEPAGEVRDVPTPAARRPPCPATPSPDRARPNPRKRPAPGHTPFDLAKCQKVRDLLDCRQDPWPSKATAKPSQKQEEGKHQLDSETLGKLCGILSRSRVPWGELAEKLGMRTLAHLYQASPSPCQNLLENYQLGGGQVEALVEALQSLGLNEGVRLLRQAEPRDKAQSTDATVDSGFGSQLMEELAEGEAEQPVLANP